MIFSIGTTPQCDFEQSTICGFTNNQAEQYHWQWHQGGTASLGTGPSADHTFGTRNGHYVYMESSAPMQPNNTAHLISPTYTGMPGSPLCMKFYYHMYGANVGTLNVYLTSGGSTVQGANPVWTRNYNQGNFWNLGQVSLYTQSQYKVSTQLIEFWNFLCNTIIARFNKVSFLPLPNLNKKR